MSAAALAQMLPSASDISSHWHTKTFPEQNQNFFEINSFSDSMQVEDVFTFHYDRHRNLVYEIMFISQINISVYLLAYFIADHF